MKIDIILGIMFLIMFTLKLLNVISFSWWIICSPLLLAIIPIILSIFFLCGAVVMALIVSVSIFLYETLKR